MQVPFIFCLPYEVFHSLPPYPAFCKKAWCEFLWDSSGCSPVCLLIQDWQCLILSFVGTAVCHSKRVKPNGFCYSVPEVICVFLLSDAPLLFPASSWFCVGLELDIEGLKVFHWQCFPPNYHSSFLSQMKLNELLICPYKWMSFSLPSPRVINLSLASSGKVITSAEL